MKWDNHDPHEPTEPLLNVLERASGIDRARRDEIAGNGPLVGARESTEALLAELQQTGLFDILDLGAIFEAASDEAIEQAFDDAIAFAGLHRTFEAIQSVLGDDIAGLGSVSELTAAKEALDLAALVRGLLLMRPLMPEGALESIVEAAREAGPQLQAAQELARALPHLIQFLGPDGPGRLDALSADERERVTSEVRDYLANRPELVAVLADD